MELAGAPVEWRALRNLGAHLLGCLGEHHLHKAASTPGEQDGRGEHLRLCGVDWEEGVVVGDGGHDAGWGRRASHGGETERMA
jgi:hypothetical protein